MPKSWGIWPIVAGWQQNSQQADSHHGWNGTTLTSHGGFMKHPGKETVCPNFALEANRGAEFFDLNDQFAPLIAWNNINAPEPFRGLSTLRLRVLKYKPMLKEIKTL
ncbi:MAG: hypothetical protein IPP03_11615 [Dechloromonas sp.]|nr:hypothetical protein [Candidatus Dechloromonas phosphoritropha]